MKVIIQRVKSAQVKVNAEVTGKISQGLLSFVGIEETDNLESLNWMIRKITDLRIFSDDQGKMNLSLKDVGGEHLCVSQFTLLGDVSKGRRPHFLGAGDPKVAKELYLQFLDLSRNLGIKTESGVFGKDMDVELTNDGPVTFFIETPRV